MNINKNLGIALIIALFIVVEKIFVTPSGDVLYRAFEVAFWISVSYVPGYFVYLFVVDFPRKRDQKNLSVFVANQTSILYGDAQVVLSELSKAADHPVGVMPSAEDFDIICKKISPHDKAPIFRKWNPSEHANWIEFLHERKERSEKAVDILLRYMLYLETEHVRLLTEIKGCTLFLFLDNISRLPLSNKDMSYLSSALFEYYKLIHDLAEYSDKHMKVVAWS